MHSSQLPERCAHFYAADLSIPSLEVNLPARVVRTFLIGMPTVVDIRARMLNPIDREGAGSVGKQHTGKHFFDLSPMAMTLVDVKASA